MNSISSPNSGSGVYVQNTALVPYEVLRAVEDQLTHRYLDPNKQCYQKLDECLEQARVTRDLNRGVRLFMGTFTAIKYLQDEEGAPPTLEESMALGVAIDAADRFHRFWCTHPREVANIPAPPYSTDVLDALEWFVRSVAFSVSWSAE